MEDTSQMNNFAVQCNDYHICWSEGLYKLKAVQQMQICNNVRFTHSLGSSHLLVMTTEGQGILRLNSNEYHLTCNYAYCCLGDDVLNMILEVAKRVTCYLFYFDVIKAKEEGYFQCIQTIKNVNIPNAIQVHLPNELALLCYVIAGLQNSGNNIEQFRSYMMFQELLYTLLRDKE